MIGPGRPFMFGVVRRLDCIFRPRMLLSLFSSDIHFLVLITAFILAELPIETSAISCRRQVRLRAHHMCHCRPA